jgi:hypothetical protein
MDNIRFLMYWTDCWNITNMTSRPTHKLMTRHIHSHSWNITKTLSWLSINDGAMHQSDKHTKHSFSYNHKMSIDCSLGIYKDCIKSDIWYWSSINLITRKLLFTWNTVNSRQWWDLKCNFSAARFIFNYTIFCKQDNKNSTENQWDGSQSSIFSVIRAEGRKFCFFCCSFYNVKCLINLTPCLNVTNWHKIRYRFVMGKKIHVF